MGNSSRAGDEGDRYGLVRIGMQWSVMTCIGPKEHGGCDREQAKMNQQGATGMTRRREGRRQARQENGGIRYGYDMLTAAAGEEEWRSSTQWWYRASVHTTNGESVGADRRDAGRPPRDENLLGSRDWTDPCGGRCLALPLPKARGGLKLHTVLSRARHLPWVSVSQRRGAGQ